MGERQDYIALEWVAGEIEETLNQASHALEAYIANRDDATKLRFCLTHIHQVHGTLQMVEFFGAALLAEEMEGMAHALAQGKIHDSHIEDALQVLKNAIAQLPKYLEKVKESRHGLPATLLPVLNDLRAVRGESLLSETVLFAPDMSASQQVVAGDVLIKGNELAEVTHKLRQMYQIALLGLIRGKDVRKNLNYLAKVCARLVKLSAGCPSQSLWRVCIAVLEGLLNSSIDASVAVKILLRQIDRQIKLIIEHGEATLAKPAPEDLLKNLLYYVARSKANSKFIKEIKAEFNLQESLLGEGELEDETLATPNSAAMQSVVEALSKELVDIKAGLQDAGSDITQLADVLPLFRRVTDTMAILGLGSTLKLVQEPYSQLAKLLATQNQIATSDIDAIVEQIARAEGELNPEAIIGPSHDQPLFNDSEEAQEQLDSAFVSVLRESRNGLEQAKEAVIEFVATQWNHSCLTEVPGLLREIRGSLNMVPLPRACKVLDSCERYVAEALLANQQVPEWQMLDTLADAITSIDYYLERLVDDADAEVDAILDVAAESVAELGYPISGESHPVDDIPVLDDTAHEQSVVETENTAFDQPPVLEPEPPILESSPGEEEVPHDDMDITLEDAPTLAEVIPLRSTPEVTADEAAAYEAEEEIPTTESVDLAPDVVEQAGAQTPDEDYDPEIVEIFIEEAGEVLETINEFLPQWEADPANDEARAEVRRAYHTLKGSGRMVGALDIGELAWSVENMLNRVLDGTVNMDAVRFELVKEVTGRVPELVTAFEQRSSFDKASIEQLIAKAELLASEQNPALDGLSAPAVDLAETVDLGASLEAGAPATDELPVLEEVVSANVENAGVEEDETDTELLEIFATEAETHDQVLKHFIDYCKDLAGPAELTDELQRALHTLKGSANMAGVMPVAEVVTLIEYMVKELRASQLKADSGVVDLLEQGHDFIHQGIEQLESTPLQPISGVKEFEARLTALLEQRLAQAASPDVEEPGIAPDALNQFLTDSLDRISAVADSLKAIEQGIAANDSFMDMEQHLVRFIDHAESVNMLSLVELGQAMEVLYRSAGRAGYNALNQDFYQLAGNGNDALIDMLDQIAGHQSPVCDAQLLAALQDFEFADESQSANNIAVDIDDFEIPTLDAGDEIILDAGEFENTLQMAAITDEDISAATGQDTFLEHDEAVDLDLDSIIAEADHDARPPVAEDDAQITAAMTDLMDAVSDDNLPSEQAAPEEPAFESPVFENVPTLDIEAPAEITPEPPVQQTAAAPVDDDDDVDDEIVEIFLEEADDLIEGIDEAIHGWGDDRGNRAHLDDLLRILHTLKGGARLAGLTQMGNLSHNFETSLIHFDNSRAEVTDDVLAEAQAYQDQLLAQLNAIKAGEKLAVVADMDAPAPASQVVEVPAAPIEEPVEAAPTEETFDLELDAEEAEASETADRVAPEPAPVAREPLAEVVPFTGNRPREVSSEQVAATAMDANTKKGPQEVVKVSAQLLEDLVNLAGETSISRGRAEEQISELVFALDEMQITVDRLQEQVRRLDMETEAQILYRQEQVESEGMEGFDPLEMDRYSQLQQLSRSLLESSSDLIDIKSTLSDKSRDMETLLIQQSRINTDLQEGLMRSRMVPFSRMVPRLRRIIRQVSGELNKKVDFHLENVEGELDRTVLERMVAPLEHMLRNAVDHGIETADVREAAGKSARGNVTLGLAREGGEIVLTLTDDGGGIDLHAVRNKAIERGLMEASAELSDHEILQFILQAGFSTATAVTQISGRGVGMDVVHSEIKQLGGSMDIDSKLGHGSRFTVRLPFTVSVNRALMVSVGGDSYAIPLNTIEGIVRVSPFELEAYYQPDAPMFEYAGQPYLLRYMGALLHRGEKPNLEGQSMPLPVVLVRGAEHSVAIQVDGLLGSREIVVKPLGPQFSMVQGLSGATVLGDGSVVVILDLLAMIRADASHMHRDFILGQDSAAEVEQSALVMVVDDSVTVRKVTSRFLERQGMEVITAKDGVDAVTQLQEIERLPDVMLLDIEMPRMDGFEVASRVKHNNRLKDIPIIMITSRTGEKHRERALSIGVNDYMGKPYQESKLLETINALLGITV